VARDGKGRGSLPRLVRLTTGYRDASHLRRGSPEARALAVTIRALAATPDLPELGDLSVLVDPDERGVQVLTHARRVLGHNLWVWYTATDDELLLRALTHEPP
jgi:hypothetical protein